MTETPEERGGVADQHDDVHALPFGEKNPLALRPMSQLSQPRKSFRVDESQALNVLSPPIRTDIPE
jgi:hypothetical protein